jgi:hypothetical protein
MRDLDNKVIDVSQAKLAYEVLVFLSRKQLCEVGLVTSSASDDVVLREIWVSSLRSIVLPSIW